MSTTGQLQNKTNKTKTIRQGRRLDDINNHRTKEASTITVSPRKQCVVVVSTNLFHLPTPRPGKPQKRPDKITQLWSCQKVHNSACQNLPWVEAPQTAREEQKSWKIEIVFCFSGTDLFFYDYHSRQLLIQYLSACGTSSNIETLFKSWRYSFSKSRKDCL